MTTTLPPNFIARPATRNDLQGIAAIFVARNMSLYGASDATVDSMAEWIETVWKSPRFDLAKDSWVIVAPDETIAGYVTLWRPPQHALEMYASPRVLPEYRGLGLTAYLLQATEIRARELIRDEPDEQERASAELNSWTETADAAAIQGLERAGYRPIRYYWRMEIEMDTMGASPPLEPVWPDGITVRTFIPNQDNRATYEAMDEGFRGSWGYETEGIEEWERYRLDPSDFDPSLWFLAMDGEEIAGAALCRYLEGEGARIGWVDELTIRPRWRKRSLAMALLRHAFAEFYRRGILKCGLTVDSENVSGATRLYERAGMHRADRSEIRFRKILKE